MIQKRKLLYALCVLCFSSLTVAAQQSQTVDILLKGGHVIDPRNKVDAVMDVAISGGKISRVAANIPEADAKKVINVSGMYVAPGFIDLHTHVFTGTTAGFANGTSSVKPDDFTFRAGVTTVVDAGTSGWKSFPAFKEQVIDRSKTRVLSFLNAFGPGMIGGAAEQDVNDFDQSKVTETINKYPDIIVGVKLGHYSGDDWSIFERAEATASAANRPLFVECHLTKFPLEGQLSRMKSGDIMTHAFEKVSERIPFVDANGRLQPSVLDAQKRGVLFDVGHGGAGFWFSQAIPAAKAGFWPNSFGTDLHHNSVNAGMKDMLNIMSKYLNIGMPLNEIIASASSRPAAAIRRDDLGNLSVGSVADVAVLKIEKGKFGYVDAGNFKMEGDQKFNAELTIRAGKVVWDLNGLTAEKWDK